MAAASLAVRAWLRAPARSARVLAAFPQAVYLQVEGRSDDPVDAGRGVVALLARDAVRLPLGVVIEADAACAPFAGVTVGDAASVGGGAVRVATRSWPVRRWWDPRVPVLAPAPAGSVVDAGEVDVAVRGLVGLGPGLTPAGDDVLCGALAALTAIGDLERRGALAAAVRRHAPRTTALSAALLLAAADGDGLPELTRLLGAVLRHESADRQRQALAALRAVGHTSGTALAAGALLALPLAFPLAAAPPLALPAPLLPVIMHVRTSLIARPGARVHDHGRMPERPEEAA